MGAEDRKEAGRARLGRQHDGGRVQIGLVDMGAAGMIQRAFRERPLDQPQRGALADGPGQVDRRAASARLQRQAGRQAGAQQFRVQGAGAFAQARVLHVQHHPVAPAARGLARRRRDAPGIAAPQRIVAHVANGGGIDRHVHVQPRPAQRGAGLHGLLRVVFDRRRVGHVFAQVEQRSADAVRLAQPRGGAHRRLDIGAADEAARQRGARGQRAHGAPGARAARQGDGGFLEKTHGLSVQREPLCGVGLVPS